MSDVPPIFLQRILEHNRHCWGAVIASIFAAGMAWMFYGVLFTGAILLFEVVRTNDVNLFRPPWWYYPTGLLLILGILISAGVGRWRHRFRAAPDRPIIGWHLIFEVIFLPAKLTFAIGDHLSARIKLSPSERRERWHLLQTIWQMGHANVSQLGGELSRPQLLAKLLPALQLTDWIDFHQSEGEWYYRVCSEQEDVLRGLRPEQSASEPVLEEE